MTDPVRPAPETERALAENERYAATFDRPNLELPPSRSLAVLACMDARLTVEQVLGLRTGEAHIIRNAGGLATDDAIRSLVISQHLRGTSEVMVIEHTGCGMLAFDDDTVRASIAADDRRGARHAAPRVPRPRGEPASPRSTGSATHPWIRDVPVTGVIYDVETGRLRRVV